MEFILEEEEDEFDIDVLVKKIMETRYDPMAPVPDEPPWSITIGGKGVALPGSIIEISGKEKSRKSTIASLIAAAILSKEGKVGNITTTINDKKVVWVDTEQSDIEVQYFQNHILKLAGVYGEEFADYVQSRYIALKLRPYDEEDRLAALDRILTSGVVENIGVIIIDGAADLMYNVNDMEAAKKVSSFFTKWADLLSVPIFSIIHTNKDGKVSTGSLGAFLDKRCSYHIRAEKEYDEGPTQIRVMVARMGRIFSPFLISNEKDGRPKFYDLALEQEVTFDGKDTVDTIKDRHKTEQEAQEIMKPKRLEIEAKLDDLPF